MIRDLGLVLPGQTLYIPFHTFDSNDPSASVTMTGLAVTDIEIYKDGSVTQRASDSGYTLLDTDGTDFDLITGIHGISINLADNTTAGFYASGSQYWVVISSVTVDAATINFVLCTFTIGYPDARLNTTIATLTSQTSFTLTNGPAEDNALNGCYCLIHDVASAVQCGHAVISGYTGATKTVTLAAGTTFTAAASDNIAVMGPAPLQPTVAGRTLDVSTGGEAGVDWANVGTPGSTVGLSATTVATTTTATNVTTVNGLAANVITDTSIAANAVTSAKVADGFLTAAKFAAGAFDAVWTVATRTLTGFSTALAVAVWDVVESAVATASSMGLKVKTNLDAAVTSRSSHSAADTWTSGTRTLTAGTNIALAKGTGVTGFTDLSAAQVADAVWDEDATAHQTQGTFGQAIGDPVLDTNTIYKAVVTDAAGATVGVDAAAILADTGTDGVVVASGSKTGYSLTATTGLGNQTADITGNLSGSVGSVTAGVTVGAINANVVTASAIADGAIDRAAFAADSGLQSIRSNTAQAGASTTITLDASASASDDFYNNAYIFLTGGAGVGQARFISDYVGATKVATVNTAWITNPDATTTFAVLPFSTIPGASAPTAADIADAVWDEATVGHQTAGTTGKALTDAVTAGDPWSTALPGAYGAGTAGNIVGNNLNATITSRASQTSLDTVDDFVDTEVAAIKAKTDQLTFTAAGKLDSNVKAVNNVTVNGAGTAVSPWGP